MKKKFLSMALALCLVFGSAASLPQDAFTDSTSITASAYGESVSGNYKYKVLNNKTVEIINYTGSDRTVNIPSKIAGKKVTVIGSNAFHNCTKIRSLTIPSTVTTIEGSAFSKCTSLTSVTVPASVKHAVINSAVIGADMFRSCSALTSVTIGSQVKSIDNYAFYSCTALKEIKIPQNVTSIGSCAFNGCTALRTAIIGNGVKSIGYEAFWGCKSLSNLNIGSNVTSIDNYAFAKCISLQEVTVPSKVEEVGNNMFAACTSLRKATLKDGVAYVSSEMFSNCTALSSVYISNTANKIGSRAFSSCKSLKTVKIPDSVISIGDNAFYNCTSLKSASLGKFLTELGYQSFLNCSNLTSITIPSMVTDVGSYAFHNCSSLKTVVLKDGCTEISSNMFSNCKSLSSITIPNTVTSIGSEAFSNCSSLKSVKIPNSVTSIGGSAFSNCSGLKNIVIGNSVTEIGSHAFNNCIALQEVIIPGSVTDIGYYAFYKCKSLKNVYILDGIITIGGGAFINCDALSYVYIGKTAVTINSEAFKNIPMKSVTIPETVMEIKSAAVGYKGYNTKVSGFVVRGFKGTEAQTYAKNNGFKFEAVDGCKCTGAKKTITIAPTCDSKGYKLTICTRCGKTTKSNYTAAYKHTFSDWTVTENATCTKTGEKIRYCKLCGKKETKTIAKLAHKHANQWKTVSFNLKTNRSVIKDKCTVCGKYVFSHTVAVAVKRFAGSNRYDTAALISNQNKGGMYKTNSTVIIATGMDFHDALIAVPLAKAYDAPLLLSSPDNITAQTKAELERLKAKKVIILNTGKALSRKVTSALSKYNPTIISGKTCFETAKKVAESLQSKIKENTKNKTTAPNSVFFTTNKNAADALSVSPIAAIKGAAILYVDPNKKTLDSNTLSYLSKVKKSVKNIYIVGGTVAIPKAVETSIKKALPNGKVTRFAGANRYETCLLINKAFAGTLTGKSVCVAKGLDFPDALAGGVFAAKNASPLLLADNALSANQKSYLKSKNPRKIYVFGGKVAVPDKIVKDVTAASVVKV